MRCTVCGGELKLLKTDPPLRVGDATIVILKDLPALQCDQCPEYLLEDPVLERVDQILTTVDSGAELEIIRYAA